MPEETELKLSIRPDQVGRIGKHPVVRNLKTGQARTRHMVSAYFDTPDMALRQRDLSLRVREVDQRHIQTLKRMKPADGAIMKRDEWEKDVATCAPDIRAFADGDIDRFFRDAVPAKKLKRLFETNVQRTVWNLRDGDAEVELALDVGEIRGENGHRVPLCEAELELKTGDARQLYDIALALNDRIDCTVGTLAKSDRGYALYRSEALTSAKAAPVVLSRDMTVWQAFVMICRNCLAHLEANAPVASIAEDPEGIHQTRVAIRRLRAAFKLFGKALPEDKRRFFMKELRWLQKQLARPDAAGEGVVEVTEPRRGGAGGGVCGRSQGASEPPLWTPPS
jgi:triphosphatase